MFLNHRNSPQKFCRFDAQWCGLVLLLAVVSINFTLLQVKGNISVIRNVVFQKTEEIKNV